MIYARHHAFMYPFFKRFIKYKLRTHFRALQVENCAQVSPTKSVLFLSNHFSWWDGFFAMYLCCEVLGKKFYFMMLEEELRKHWYFQQIGGFSIKQGSRSVMASLQHAEELLEDPENLVLMFPQGKLFAGHTTEFKFQAGVNRLLNSERQQTIFNYNCIDYFNHPKPTAYLHLANSQSSGIELEAAYNQFANQIINQQKQKTV